MRLYLDSNVFISFVRSEIDGAFNLRFKDAETFFACCRECRAELVVSELFFDEVKLAACLEKEAVKEILASFGVLLNVCENAEETKARNIATQTGIHLSDAEHVATAVKNGCNGIITWNKKDFEKANKIIPCYSPSELVQSNP